MASPRILRVAVPLLLVGLLLAALLGALAAFRAEAFGGAPGAPPAAPAAGPVDPPRLPKGWYENDTQGVRQTWSQLNLSGTGVFIGVLDSGVDFGNPALLGRYAVQPVTISGSQAYAGWPIAFDARSVEVYLADPGRVWPANWVHLVNSARAITGTGVYSFADPLDPTDTYTVPGTSQSGRYLLGYHPDPALKSLLLAADETVPGRYDAVYVDIDDDGTFETRLDRNNPVGTLDRTGDGVPDRSTGLLYWIADGIHTLPGMEVVHGPGGPVPPAGALLAFMIDRPGEPGGGHGTECASTAVGSDGGAFVPSGEVAPFYSAAYGSLVQGPAPGARVIAMGNVYAGGALEAWYRFTVLGNDGVAGTGDEPHIVTLSYGGGLPDNEGWEWESRYLTLLNLSYGGGSPLIIHSAGNGGPGYGTNIAPYPATALIVGASTQYGTAKRWGVSETVSLPERVNWGDVNRFSARGPGADGRGAIDLVANGRYGTGAYPLNYSADGTVAYVHWSGTSRSGPAAAGMAALAYQGFHQAHGRYPTYREGFGLMMNGAIDLGYDPLVQGAGMANAFLSAQSALGQYGATVDPPRVDAGSFRGASFPAFSSGLMRGQVVTLPFTVSNPAVVPVTVSLAAVHLVELARYTATVHTLAQIGSNYGHGAPDYALNLTPWITAHPEADLMVVRMMLPFEVFDTVPPTPPASRNSWWLVLYNWWDDHRDGAWWTDLNGNGRVEWPAELDGGDEWMRFDYSPLDATLQELRVGRPYARSVGARSQSGASAGIWAGAAYRSGSSGGEPTVLTFEAVFYQQRSWEAVALSDGSARAGSGGTDASPTLAIPAGSAARFQATISVPADAPLGFYQGMVVVTDAGRLDVNPLFAPRQVNVPFTWQVLGALRWGQIGQAGSAAAGLTVGGGPRAGTPYDNGRVSAGFDWYVYDESGDWRFFGFDVENPPEGSVILAHSWWQDYPSDLDTLIFGPAADQFSSAHPEWFGPYTLDRVGGSQRVGSAPAWQFQTATGGTEEWAAAPAGDGLHLLMEEAVLLGGHQAEVPFTAEVGLAGASPYPLRIVPSCGLSCTVAFTFRSGIAISDGLTGTGGYGWSRPMTITGSVSPGGSVTSSLVFTRSLYRFDAAVVPPFGLARPALALYDDSGPQPGRWDAGDALRGTGSVLAPAGRLTARNLAAGQYWVAVGDPAGGDFILEITAHRNDAAGALSFWSLPDHIAANQPGTVTIRVERAPAPGERGLLVLGPRWLPDVIELPILVEPAADLWVTKAGPREAHSGRTVVFTITFGNHGPYTATGVVLTDSLPAGITAGSDHRSESGWPDRLGQLTLDAGALAPGAVHTWTLTGTVDLALDPAVLTNTVRISAASYDPKPSNDAASAALARRPYRLYFPFNVFLSAG